MSLGPVRVEEVIVDLRHLRVFCVVAQEMQVTNAAKRLKMAQPALTQQIRLLEKALGQRLVRPKGRGIELTEAGAFFHTEAEAVLLSLHNAQLRLNEIARGQSGHLRIGVTEGASFNPQLAAVLTEFRKTWPGVQLSFTQRQTPDLASDLRNNVIDAAFMCPLTHPDGLSLEPLYAENMLAAIPCEHSLASRASISVLDLEDVPVFVISHGNTEHSLESSLGKACERQGMSPRIAQTVPEFMLALNLVASGLGLTFVPAYMNNIHTHSIAYRRIEALAGIVMETVFAQRSGDASPLVQNLCTIAQRLYQPNGLTTEPPSISLRRPGKRRKEGAVISNLP